MYAAASYCQLSSLLLAKLEVPCWVPMQNGMFQGLLHVSSCAGFSFRYLKSTCGPLHCQGWVLRDGEREKRRNHRTFFGLTPNTWQGLCAAPKNYAGPCSPLLDTKAQSHQSKLRLAAQCNFAWPCQDKSMKATAAGHKTASVAGNGPL